MLHIQKRFRSGVTGLLIFNILTALVAMVMIERLIPTQKSERLVLERQMNALVTLYFDSDLAQGAPAFDRSLFTLLDEKAWGKSQEIDLKSVRSYLESPELLGAEERRATFRRLIKAQENRIRAANESQRLLGLSASWSIAILSFLSLGYILFFRNRMERVLVEPLGEFIHGLKDWKSGNRLRRLVKANADREVSEAIDSVNEILDQR